MRLRSAATPTPQAIARRMRHLVCAAAAVWLASSAVRPLAAAESGAVVLSWQGPAGCPRESELRARIERELAAMGDRQPVAIDADVDIVATGLVLRVRVRRQGEESARELRARDCGTLADGLVLLAVLGRRGAPSGNEPQPRPGAGERPPNRTPPGADASAANGGARAPGTNVEQPTAETDDGAEANEGEQAAPSNVSAGDTETSTDRAGADEPYVRASGALSVPVAASARESAVVTPRRTPPLAAGREVATAHELRAPLRSPRAGSARARVDLGVAATQLGWTGLAPELSAAGGVTSRYLDVDLRGSYAFLRPWELPNGARVEFRTGQLMLSACKEWGGPLRLGPCAVLGAVIVRAHPRGLEAERGGASAWATAGLGVRARYELGRALSILLEGTLQLAISPRAGFSVVGHGQAGDASYVGRSGRLAVAYRFE